MTCMERSIPLYTIVREDSEHQNQSPEDQL